MANSSSSSRYRARPGATSGPGSGLRHAVFALLLATCSLAQADTFRIGIFANGDRPFSFPQGSPQPGIYPDLMRAIARESGDQIELVYVPAARLLRMFEIGELDIEVGSNPAWRKNSPISSVYSASYATAYEILCFFPGAARSGNAAKDFPGYDIGVQAGYYYPNFEKAFADGSVKRRDTNNAEQLLKMLNAKRFPAIIISKYAADFYKKMNSAQYTCEQGAITDQAQEMLRLPASKADALPRLNAAIAKLKKSGEIEAIYAKYR